LKNLGTRIAVVISSILIGLLLLVGFVVDQQLTRSIKSEDIAQTQTHARTMLASLHTLMLNGQGMLAREWLERMSREPGIVDIEVVRKDGHEAFTDTTTIEAVNQYIEESRFNRQAIAATRQPLDQRTTYFSLALGGEMAVDDHQSEQVVVYAPIKVQPKCLDCHGYDKSPLRGVLKLAVSTEGASDRVHAMRINLWGMSSLLVLILAIVLWVALRQSIFRPIGALRDALWQAGEGNRKVKLLVSRQDEIGELSVVFNRMQKQLSATEARAGAVMNSVIEPIVIIDDHGVIEQVNPAFERKFGYREGDVTGKNVTMLMSRGHRPEHDRAVEDYLSEHFMNAVERNLERECVRKDGSVFPVAITISEMYIDDVCSYICIVREIDERQD